MSISNPLSARFDEIARNYGHKFETRSEFEERHEAASVESGRWFDDATKPQKQAYLAAIRGLAGYYSPRSNRAREAAKASFYASTGDAAELCLKAFEDHMRDGEVSPATAEAFEALIATPANAEAA